MKDESAKRKQALRALLLITPTPQTAQQLTLLQAKIQKLAWRDYLEWAAPFTPPDTGARAFTDEGIRDALQLAMLQNHLLRLEVLQLADPDAILIPMVRKVVAAKRDKAPKEDSPLKNWLKPMPVHSERPPVGYVQATAQNRRRITRFLSSIGAKPISQRRRPGKGAPLKLYSVSTNLRVLDEWLAKWHIPDPEAKLQTILHEVFRLEKSDAAASAVRNVRLILKRHLAACAGGLGESSADMAELILTPALKSDAGWKGYVEEAATRSRDYLKQTQNRTDGPTDPIFPPADAEKLRILHDPSDPNLGTLNPFDL